MDKFLKIQNFTRSQEAFTNWMMERYALDISTVKDMDVKKLLFETMKSVKDEYINDPDAKKIDVDKLNNIALNKLQEKYIDKLTLRVNRDVEIFGNRTITPSTIPENDIELKDEVSKQFETLLSERNATTKLSSAVFKNEPLKEEAIPLDEFNKMFASYQSNQQILESNIEVQLPKIPENPRALYEATTHIPPTSDLQSVYKLHEEMSIPNNSMLDRELTLINQDHNGTIDMVKKYLIINGFDRDLSAYKQRYNFKMDFGDMNNTYKKIKSLKFNKLIIPSDYDTICKPTLIQTTENGRLSVPYILLNIDEYTNNYDGFNQNVKKAFTSFIYDTS